MSKQIQQFNTLAVHAGVQPDPTTGSRQVPIHQTSSYEFKNSEHASNLFALKEFGYIYTRLHNPTVKALEDRIAALEGGIFAVATSSGHAAQLVALFNLLQSGDEIAAANKLYGGTINQFSKTFNQFGWTTRFFDESNVESLNDAINDKTKAVFIESVTNPNGEVVDIEKIAKIAHSHGVPLLVDNTIATPYLINPFEYGADIVIHSTTKFLSGNGTSIGGVIVDSGKFDWKANADKFPLLTQPDSSYNGISFADTFGELGFSVRSIAVGLRDLGTPQSPFNAFLTLNGIETLPLRVERHVSNAEKLAEWLNNHPKVAKVSHPKYDSNSDKKLYDKYLKKGATSVFTFTLKDGNIEKGRKVVESLELFSHLANVGDAKSLIIHPASTTHSQVPDEEKKRVGAAPELLRVSVGIEDINDIIADLENALGQI